jgi:hypothetical protein
MDFSCLWHHYVDLLNFKTLNKKEVVVKNRGLIILILVSFSFSFAQLSIMTPRFGDNHRISLQFKHLFLSDDVQGPGTAFYSGIYKLQGNFVIDENLALMITIPFTIYQRDAYDGFEALTESDLANVFIGGQYQLAHIATHNFGLNFGLFLPTSPEEALFQTYSIHTEPFLLPMYLGETASARFDFLYDGSHDSGLIYGAEAGFDYLHYVGDNSDISSGTYGRAGLYAGYQNDTWHTTVEYILYAELEKFIESDRFTFFSSNSHHLAVVAKYTGSAWQPSISLDYLASDLIDYVDGYTLGDFVLGLRLDYQF